MKADIAIGEVEATINFETATDGSTTPTTKSASLALVYAAGPVKVAGRYINSKNDTWTGDTTKNSFDLGASYDLGMAKLGLGYDSKRRGKGTGDKAAVTASISAPVGPVGSRLRRASCQQAPLS